MAKRAKKKTRPRGRPKQTATPSMPFRSRADCLRQQRLHGVKGTRDFLKGDDQEIRRLAVAPNRPSLMSLPELAFRYARELEHWDLYHADQLLKYLAIHVTATSINPFCHESLRQHITAVTRTVRRLAHNRRKWQKRLPPEKRNRLSPDDEKFGIREVRKRLAARYPRLERLFDDKVKADREAALEGWAGVQARDKRTVAFERNVRALKEHHEFDGKTCGNWQPIAAKTLAKKVGVTPSVISVFFERYFDGHATYRSLCEKHKTINLDYALSNLTIFGGASRLVARESALPGPPRRPKCGEPTAPEPREFDE